MQCSTHAESLSATTWPIKARIWHTGWILSLYATNAKLWLMQVCMLFVRISPRRCKIFCVSASAWALVWFMLSESNITYLMHLRRLPRMFGLLTILYHPIWNADAISKINVIDTTISQLASSAMFAAKITWSCGKPAGIGILTSSLLSFEIDCSKSIPCLIFSIAAWRSSSLLMWVGSFQIQSHLCLLQR